MKKLVNNILLILGILLIISSVAYVAFSYVAQNKAIENSQAIVSEIYDIIPDITNGFIDEQTSNVMPSVEIDGMNFVAVVEVPLYKSVLPVYSKWDSSEIPSFPCRYTGNIYERNLIIGGSDNKEQFDFMKMISFGDTVCVTDMTGAKFSYTVSDIIITKDASTETLTKQPADLVLFAPNSTSFDYTVIYCILMG